eukprot:TRINITY_DN616_c0_g2_i1.p1 TRINITY_DN616_c0_g2~~TRINITY_DN616_c0_g2_i1.p1  ORF type:complete len:447 (-),score=110.52 TRINITY_DN616_c0_g2_i1:131-1471(-)
MALSSRRMMTAAATGCGLLTCVHVGEAFVTSPSSSAELRQQVVAAGGATVAGRPHGLESRRMHQKAETEAAPFSTATFFASVVALAGVSAAAHRRSSDRGLVARRARMVATRPDQAIPWWQRLVRPRIEEGVGIWAEKLNMTTIFDEQDGNWRTIPATILVIKRGGNVVTGKRWPEKHGYYAVQMGYDQRPPEEMKYVAKRGGNTAELAMAKIAPLKKLREFTCRPQDWEKYEVGQKVWPSEIFKEGDIVDLHSRSKGKGFQGNVTRWGLHRGPMSHGSKHHRRVGSVAGDGRVWPGKKMPGWVGDTMHCQKGGKILKIIDRIDEDNMPESIIVISGSVAGYTAHTEKGGSYVYLHPSKSKYGMTDGRFKRDPVWLWYTAKGEDVDELVPLRKQAWTWKTHWGQDMRWKTAEVKKYWPDGFPGYDHGPDPFHDECDPHLAIKAPEW